MGSFLAAAGLELISSLERDMTGFSAVPHTEFKQLFHSSFLGCSLSGAQIKLREPAPTVSDSGCTCRYLSFWIVHFGKTDFHFVLWTACPARLNTKSMDQITIKTGCCVAQIVAHRLAVLQARVRISAWHPRGGPLPSRCNEEN